MERGLEDACQTKEIYGGALRIGEERHQNKVVRHKHPIKSIPNRLALRRRPPLATGEDNYPQILIGFKFEEKWI